MLKFLEKRPVCLYGQSKIAPTSPLLAAPFWNNSLESLSKVNAHLT